MKTLSSLLLLFLLVSCAQKESAVKVNFTNLDFIDMEDTLHLTFVDEKCGEWGGDYRKISIYKEYFAPFKYNLKLDVCEYKINCDSIDYYYKNPKRKTLEKKEIAVNDSLLALISLAIEEVIQQKMNFEEVQITHSGNFSGMNTTNKKLSLGMYPSDPWIKFDELYSLLTSDLYKD